MMEGSTKDRKWEWSAIIIPGEELPFSNSGLIREAEELGGGLQRVGRQCYFSHLLLDNNVTPCFFQCPGKMDFAIALSMCSAPVALWESCNSEILT